MLFFSIGSGHHEAVAETIRPELQPQIKRLVIVENSFYFSAISLALLAVI